MPLDIISGLSGLKTAAELTKTLRDGLKAGQIKPDEIAGRIGEIYDYIIDSRAALVDAQDQVQQLKARIRHLEDKTAIAEDLLFDGAVYWRKSEGNSSTSPYCQVCWDKDQQLVRCQNFGTDGQGTKMRYYCAVHNISFYSPGSGIKST